MESRSTDLTLSRRSGAVDHLVKRIPRLHFDKWRGGQGLFHIARRRRTHLHAVAFARQIVHGRRRQTNHRLPVGLIDGPGAESSIVEQNVGAAIAVQAFALDHHAVGIVDGPDFAAAPRGHDDLPAAVAGPPLAIIAVVSVETAPVVMADHRLLATLDDDATTRLHGHADAVFVADHPAFALDVANIAGLLTDTLVDGLGGGGTRIAKLLDKSRRGSLLFSALGRCRRLIAGSGRRAAVFQQHRHPAPVASGARELLRAAAELAA